MTSELNDAAPEQPFGTSEPIEEQRFSRAFDNFVGDDETLEGLIAYALYKKGVREDLRQGGEADRARRNPNRTTVDVFKSAAKERLESYAVAAIEERLEAMTSTAYHEANQAVGAEVRSAQAALEGTIRERTQFWAGVLSNTVAWFISLVLTVVLLALIGQRNMVGALFGSTDSNAAPVAQARPREVLIPPPG